MAGALLLRPRVGRLLVATGLAAAACLALSATARAGDGDLTLPGPLPVAEELTEPIAEVVPVITEATEPLVDAVEVVAPLAPAIAPVGPAVEPVGGVVAPLAPEGLGTIAPATPVSPIVDPLVDAAEPILDITPEIPLAPTPGHEASPSAGGSRSVSTYEWPSLPTAPAPIDLSMDTVISATAAAPLAERPGDGSARSSVAVDDSATTAAPADDGRRWAYSDIAMRSRIALAPNPGPAAADEAGSLFSAAAALVTTLLLGVVLAGWSVLRATAEHPFSLPRLVPVPPG